jgi:glucan 1,3-beta-glucosidase
VVAATQSTVELGCRYYSRVSGCVATFEGIAIFNQHHSVNLGGWLNTEPFITPALYEKYQTGATPAIDEYTLCQNMANDTASGGLSQLENHYATFIVSSVVLSSCDDLMDPFQFRRKRTLRRSLRLYVVKFLVEPRIFLTECMTYQGLNFVRIPVGYWAIETYPGEPFLEGTSWK